jgi:hypothetical protein
MTSKSKTKPELRKRAPSADDKWRDMAHEAAAREMAKWLKAGLNVQKPIQTLTLAQMKILANIAIDQWIVLGSTREQWQKENATETKAPTGFV